MVCAVFRKLCLDPHKLSYKYLSQKENLALESLKNNSNLVIRVADKGVAIVVQNKDDYLREARRLLSKSHTYKVLPKDPLSTYNLLLQELIHESHKMGVINRNEKMFLIRDMPYIYHIPKVHKDPVCPLECTFSMSSFTSLKVCGLFSTAHCNIFTSIY